MADEGATIYYYSKQSFSFERTCNYLNQSGWFIKNPNTQLITGINEGDFAEKNQNKVKQIVVQSKELGIEIWSNNKQRIFWSIIERNNFFLQNFTFNYLDYDDIEKRTSKIFLEFALQELTEVGEGMLGFTLDQFGHTEYYDFETIFEPDNSEILTDRYFPDITFLPKEKFTRVSLNDECEIIQLNQKFDCIAKNQELSNYLKSLL